MEGGGEHCARWTLGLTGLSIQGWEGLRQSLDRPSFCIITCIYRIISPGHRDDHTGVQTPLNTTIQVVTGGGLDNWLLSKLFVNGSSDVAI